MAEKTTQFDQLVFDFAFVDGDARTQRINNPRNDITSAQITELNQFLQANNALIGDKGGSTFGRIKKVVRRRGTQSDIDL